MRDEFVLPQGFDSYSFPRPRFNTTGSLSRSIETTISTSKRYSNTTVVEPIIPDTVVIWKTPMNFILIAVLKVRRRPLFSWVPVPGGD